MSVIEPGYVQTPLAAKQLGDNAPWRQADFAKRRKLGDELDEFKMFNHLKELLFSYAYLYIYI